LVSVFLFFFFQAEDGIRDFHVTGVQTCALPISNEIKTATKPIKKEIRAPTNTRLNKSLPYLSVPKTKVFSLIKPSMELFGKVCKGTVFSGPNRPSDAYSVYTNVSLEIV